MGSYDDGKKEACKWIRMNVPVNRTILDVGACDGKWRKLLHEYEKMDACEVFPKNAERIKPLYRQVFACDIADLEYEFYDLVIFGDVIEHMDVETAQKVLEYAKEHAGAIIVGVPFRYLQGEVYGNPWERHVQDDLTHELFCKRYKGFRVLCRARSNYCYYVSRR